MLLRYERRRKWEVDDFGESTSGKLSALGMVPGDGTEVLRRGVGYTYEQGELRGRVGKERGGKETDRCPLTLCRQVIVEVDDSSLSNNTVYVVAAS
jgi:hypothetical protein